MDGGNSRNLERLTKDIKSTFPIEKLKVDVNFALGYYMALTKLVRKGFLSPTQCCLLIADSLHFDCVQKDYDLISFVGEATKLSQRDSKNFDCEDNDFKFLEIWLLRVCHKHTPVRWEENGW